MSVRDSVKFKKIFFIVLSNAEFFLFIGKVYTRSPTFMGPEYVPF